jgi:glucosamine--fructose-6-phosphate aminotransferase (isomerizing)
MCGIFGYISKNKKDSTDNLKYIIDNLFLLSESRGKDASGLAVIQKGTISVLKEATAASRLIKKEEYNEIFRNLRKHLIPHETVGFMGHARMVTNGSMTKDVNNQPVVKDGIVVIHNGIIINDSDLWEEHDEIKKRYEVDTEVVLSLLRSFLNEENSLIEAAKKLYRKIEGAASLAIFFEDFDCLLITTNTGSVYYIFDEKSGEFIFASEYYFLQEFLKRSSLEKNVKKIKHLEAGNGLLIDLSTISINNFSLFKKERKIIKIEREKRKIINLKNNYKTVSSSVKIFRKESEAKKLIEASYEKTLKAISSLRRCVKCILPETMPFIQFDKNGICNYCKRYTKMELLGETALMKTVKKFRRKDGKPDCIVTFSGGRDSSYGLHYIKEVLQMNPVAYSYDWGMITDLGRRNQSLMTAKLGIEHILISANIQKKRENIRKNVEAWLKDPDLGTIPLFMAGDKQYFYYANVLKKQMGIDLVFLCENPLEKTDFKSGFCGISPAPSQNEKYYTLSMQSKLRMVFYYASRYIKNPAYINSSLLDTMQAFMSYYFIPHEYVSLYKYIEWEEKSVDRVLKNYNWEIADDTPTTWRIGDGTAAFYNYIYFMMAGFSENDTFRSNQIREGHLSRKQGLQIASEENKPRIESLHWYCETIGLDSLQAVRAIAATDKIYK